VREQLALAFGEAESFACRNSCAPAAFPVPDRCSGCSMQQPRFAKQFADDTIEDEEEIAPGM
jgi:hypothetical protein